MKSDLHDVEVYVHHETAMAWLVSLDGDRKSAVWVPKSQCEVSTGAPGDAVLTAPEGLLIEKGLV